MSLGVCVVNFSPSKKLFSLALPSSVGEQLHICLTVFAFDQRKLKNPLFWHCCVLSSPSERQYLWEIIYSRRSQYSVSQIGEVMDVNLSLRTGCPSICLLCSPPSRSSLTTAFLPPKVAELTKSKMGLPQNSHSFLKTLVLCNGISITHLQPSFILNTAPQDSLVLKHFHLESTSKREPEINTVESSFLFPILIK